MYSTTSTNWSLFLHKLHHAFNVNPKLQIVWKMRKYTTGFHCSSLVGKAFLTSVNRANKAAILTTPQAIFTKRKIADNIVLMVMTLVCDMTRKFIFLKQIYILKAISQIIFTDCKIHFLATLDPLGSFTTRKGLMQRQYANKKKIRKILPWLCWLRLLFSDCPLLLDWSWGYSFSFGLTTNIKSESRTAFIWDLVNIVFLIF